MKVYADTSFLVSLYYLDAHSAEAARRVNPGRELFLTPLAELELVNALQLRVFRGEASPAEIYAARKELEGDIRAGVFSAVQMPLEAYELARRISTKRTAALGGRTLDILHVACAKLLRAERFWTFDVRQAELARAEGLRLR
ncbi:MAG TPA: type II toxin-antitoxin system VapC family toxin [Candidatus Sulfotelmatobacter sp.]|nr:type II toxin-antitoxin system VapC family toxin [Candidatus Sulfotelmatobacter sp.]